MNLEVLLNSTSAGKIVKSLDAKDTKGVDGKIEASVWNAFVADKGGKTIKHSISLENAIKSVTTYIIRENAKSRGNIEKLANKWLNLVNMNTYNPKDSNPPQKLDSKFTTPNLSNANKEITDPATGNVVIYDSEGYIDHITDKNGCLIFERHRNGMTDYGYGAATPAPSESEKELIVSYNLDGTVKEYERYQADERGYTVDGTQVIYNPDGTVKLSELDIEG